LLTWQFAGRAVPSLPLAARPNNRNDVLTT